MSATPISQAYTISSAAPPREYSDFEAMIFSAVAASSPRVSQEGATANGANTANPMIMTYKTPAILALRDGDVSMIRSIIFGSLESPEHSTSFPSWVSRLSSVEAFPPKRTGGGNMRSPCPLGRAEPAGRGPAGWTINRLPLRRDAASQSHRRTGIRRALVCRDPVGFRYRLPNSLGPDSV